MRHPIQRFFKISAAALMVAAGLAAVAVPSRPTAAQGIDSFTLIKRPDLAIDGWSVGQMWDTAAHKSVPAVIVRVKNIGNANSVASTTRINHNGNIFNMPTQILAPNQTFNVAAPLTNGSLCGILSVQVDANNNNTEWHEDNNSFAVAIDCFP